MDDKCTQSGASNEPSTSAKRFFISCMVCQESIPEHDLTTLRCKHIFHFKCIMDFFMEGRNFCPACNQQAHITDIVLLLHPNHNISGTSAIIKKLANYRQVMQKEYNAHLDNLELKKKELETAIEKLNVQKKNIELKQKYLKLKRQNKTSKNLKDSFGKL